MELWNMAFANKATGKTSFLCGGCYDEIFRDEEFKKYFYTKHLAAGLAPHPCTNCKIEDARARIEGGVR